MKQIKLIKVLRIVLSLLLPMLFGSLAISKPAGAAESTYIIERYESQQDSTSVIEVVEGILDHDRKSLDEIAHIARKYKNIHSKDQKVFVRLGYVEARAVHLKGWIVGIKKLKRMNGRNTKETARDFYFIRDLNSSKGRKELEGLHSGLSILLIISDNESKNGGVNEKLRNLADRVMLMEVNEYYRLLEGSHSESQGESGGEKLRESFDDSLVFLSKELKHLKRWYVRHAKQG